MHTPAPSPHTPAETPPDDPWAISPDDFHPGALPSARLAQLAAWAHLAPSSHNTQPWRFVVAGDALHLFADLTRRLPVVDPDDRALVISCGAALGQLRIAAAALGEALEVTLPDPAPEGARPNPAPDGALAHIVARGATTPAADGLALLAALRSRRTTRRPFMAEPLPAGLGLSLHAAAAREGVALDLVQDPARKHAMAELVAEGDRAQMADPAFRAELAAWLHARAEGSGDGMSGQAFGMPDVLTFMGRLAIRSFDMGDGQAAKDMALADGAPALAVLATPGDAPRDWLATGQALAFVLAGLGMAGLTASYLNQPVEVPALRPRLAALLDTAAQVPQLLLRLGRGEALPPSARRPLAAVLEVAG